MSKQDYKKYWFLKLPKDFYNQHDIKILESLPKGKEYSLFYTKLLLESITHAGELRFNDLIPYDANMLGVITNTDVDTVKSALDILVNLQLIEIWDDKTIYMTEVQKLIGSETGAASRKREYRKIKGDNVPLLSQTCPQEKEIEIEKEKEIEYKYNLKYIKLTQDQVDKIRQDYPNVDIDNQVQQLEEYIEMNANKNKYKEWNLVLRKAIREKWFIKEHDKTNPTWYDEYKNGTIQQSEQTNDEAIVQFFKGAKDGK